MKLHRIKNGLIFTAFFTGKLFAQNLDVPIQWNFDEYRNAYPDQVSRIRTSQSGKKELEPALDFRVEGERHMKNNSKLREQIRMSWRDLLGPSQRNTAPLNARVLEEKEFPNYIRKKVEYIGDPGEIIRAWLFIPKNAQKKKTPAIPFSHFQRCAPCSSAATN